MAPVVMLRAAVFTAAYLAVTVAAFYVTIKAYGLPGLGPVQAAAIYCFVLALVILVPLPSDLGVSEGSGVGILLAFGVPLAQGLTIMLINRLSMLLFTEIIAGGVLFALRREFRQMTREPVSVVR